MKKVKLMRQIKLNAIGSAICSIGVIMLQIIILWTTGSLHFTIDAHVVRVMVQLYAGSFMGLFSVLQLSSTKL
jgi:Co/Zn/Cd efflux system component